jgi:hypothetical protein
MFTNIQDIAELGEEELVVGALRRGRGFSAFDEGGDIHGTSWGYHCRLRGGQEMNKIPEAIQFGS